MGNNVERDSKIERESIIHKINNISENLDFPTEILNEIKNSTAYEIQEKILLKKYTLPKIIKIYQRLKQLDNNSHNAITQTFYKKPLEKSEKLQKKINKNEINKKTHPLLGFIFSIKESNILKNTKSTNGFYINLNTKSKKQPNTIKLLKRKGGIITTKGNVPQGLLSIEANNNIYKNTKNPYNKKRTSGGSSGGEAVLVSLGLVNISIGSDTGGSIRIPCLFCGIVGFKPTSNRISCDLAYRFFDELEFAKKLKPRQGAFKGCVGPIGKCVKDCEEVMKVLVEGTEFDYLVPPLGWKVEKVKRVAFLKDLDILPVCITQKRALYITRRLLLNKGFEIEEIDLSDLFEEIFILSMAGLAKNEQLIDILKGNVDLKEKVSKSFQNTKKLLSLPLFFLKRILSKLKKDDRRVLLLKARILSLTENTNFIKKRISKSYIKFQKKMKEINCKIIISPGLVTPAIKHNTSQNSGLQEFYTVIYNLYNMLDGVLLIKYIFEN